MIGVLVGAGAVLVILGGLGDLQMSPGLVIALGMIVVAVLAIRIDAWLLNGRS
jgi:hypothetical protein